MGEDEVALALVAVAVTDAQRVPAVPARGHPRAERRPDAPLSLGVGGAEGVAGMDAGAECQDGSLPCTDKVSNKEVRRQAASAYFL